MNPCESLRQFWIDRFNTYGESVLPFQVKSTLMKKLWLSKYKSFPPIEDMPEKEKREMKAYIISMFPELSIPEKLDACKIVYTIGNCL
jgi:hypothetical protein